MVGQFNAPTRQPCDTHADGERIGWRGGERIAMEEGARAGRGCEAGGIAEKEKGRRDIGEGRRREE